MQASSTRRHPVGAIIRAPPALQPPEASWAREAFDSQYRYALSARSAGPHVYEDERAPWDVAFRDPCVSGTGFVSGSLGAFFLAGRHLGSSAERSSAAVVAGRG